MTDSHAHLVMFPPKERLQLLARAREEGVERVLVPATGKEDLLEVAALPEEFGPQTPVALGFHPHNASQLDEGAKRLLERLLGRPGVVAVGEVGLDYHYMNSPQEDQRRALSWQLALAREAGLPVVLHHREAWEDFLSLLQPFAPVAGVAHSFTEGGTGVAAVEALGLYVSISGMVTFPKAENVREVAKAASLERLLVETDAPYLAPVPHRGKPNQPAWVRLVAEAVASCREMPLEALEKASDENFARLFSPSP